MDEFLEGSVGFLFRIIKSIIKGLIFDTLCYGVGWVFLRIITLGKRPRAGLISGAGEGFSEESLVSLVGVVVIVLVSLYFGKSGLF